MLWEDPEKHSMGHPIPVLDLLHPSCYRDTLPQKLQITGPPSVMLKYYLVGVWFFFFYCAVVAFCLVGFVVGIT